MGIFPTLVFVPPGVRPITCKWVTRLRLTPMVLLSITKLVLWLVAFSGNMALIMMRLFAPTGHMTTVRTLLVVASIRHDKKSS